MTITSSKDRARLIAKAAGEKKGEDIVLLDMAGKPLLCDWFILITASSSRRIKAISDEIRKRLSSEKVYPGKVEGMVTAGWVLLDYGDIVVHIFTESMREFYGLERLWSDTPRENYDIK